MPSAQTICVPTLCTDGRPENSRKTLRDQKEPLFYGLFSEWWRRGRIPRLQAPAHQNPVKLGPSEQPARCLRTTSVYHKKRSVVNRRRPLPHAPKDWGRAELGLESLSDHLDHGGGARGLDARCLGRGEDAAASAAGRCAQDRHAGLRKRGQDRRMKL